MNETTYMNSNKNPQFRVAAKDAILILSLSERGYCFPDGYVFAGHSKILITWSIKRDKYYKRAEEEKIHCSVSVSYEIILLPFYVLIPSSVLDFEQFQNEVSQERIGF